MAPQRRCALLASLSHPREDCLCLESHTSLQFLESSSPFPSGNESEQMNPSHHILPESLPKQGRLGALPLHRWSPLCPAGERKEVEGLPASRANSNTLRKPHWSGLRGRGCVCPWKRALFTVSFQPRSRPWSLRTAGASEFSTASLMHRDLMSGRGSAGWVCASL